MSALAHYALTASLLLSAFGALIMCLLVFRYGFTPAGEDEPGQAARRAMITRTGHAIAGACFAATAILAVIVLAQPSRAPRSTPPAALASSAALRDVDSRVNALAARADATDSRLASADSRMTAVESRMAEGQAEVGKIDTRVGVLDRSLRQLGDELGQTTARIKEMERLAVAKRPAPANGDRARRTAADDRVPAPSASTAAAPSPVSAAPAPVPPPRASVTLPTPPPPAPSAMPFTASPSTPAPASGVVVVPEAAPAPVAPPRPRIAEPTPVVTPRARVAEPVPPPAAAPSPAAPSARARQPEDWRSRVINDWNAMKRGFSAGADDFRRSLDDTLRQLRP